MAIEAMKGESSTDRVARAAKALGLDIEIRSMEQSTRTAQEAADACNCVVGQIVKSLIFERSDNGELVLVLVSGQNNADMNKLKAHFGCDLERANPRKIRDLTGFAIGGVAPIGHLIDLQTVIDEDLATFRHVWAAAGKPVAVFKVDTHALIAALACDVIDLKMAR